MTKPAISVVIPTHNRADSVIRLLRALARQQPPDAFEAIVVADGCTDATAARVAALRDSIHVHVLEIAPSGPAVARNCGVALARADVLLFLDDDVEPEEGVLAAHLELHRATSRAIGLGYLPLVARGGGFFQTALRGWWESMFDGPRRPGHRYSYRNLLTGHFSIGRAEFDALGGFVAHLSCHEDWEFGFRALQAGLQMTFLPGAVAWHHDNTDLQKTLTRKFEEGVADVALARLHPELIPSLPLGWSGPSNIRHSRLAELAWKRPAAGDRIFRALLGMLPLYERWRLRFRWRARLERALTYHYLRGVASAAGTAEALDALIAAAPPPGGAEVAIDLAEGFQPAAARVDALRPRSVRVVLGSHIVGDISDEPGAERLRGAHLREALAGVLSARLASALAAEHRLPPVIAATLREYLAMSERGVVGSAQAFAA